MLFTLYAGVTQSMLETVVPRATRSKVMIVGGARKGQVIVYLNQYFSYSVIPLDAI